MIFRRASSRAHPAAVDRRTRGRRKDREQVAAVCYRINDAGIEFLLVLTSSGRWTFPKGGLEPGFTHAQTAALEAFEEGGVHGRIEHVSFARYTRRKRGKANDAGAAQIPVQAFLCEVLRLEPPEDAGRKPTWFVPEKAKARLRQYRKPIEGEEMSRVVDRAVARIQRLHRSANAGGDALQQVQFEATEATRLATQHMSRAAALARRLQVYFPKTLRFDSALHETLEPSATVDNVPQVIEIDTPSSRNRTK